MLLSYLKDHIGINYSAHVHCYEGTSAVVQLINVLFWISIQRQRAIHIRVSINRQYF